MCMAAALGMHRNFYQIRGPRFGINEQHFSNQRLSLAQKKLQYFCRLHTPDHAGNLAKHTISSRIRVSGWVLCLRTETAQTWSVLCDHGNLSRKFTDCSIYIRLSQLHTCVTQQIAGWKIIRSIHNHIKLCKNFFCIFSCNPLWV